MTELLERKTTQDVAPLTPSDNALSDDALLSKFYAGSFLELPQEALGETQPAGQMGLGFMDFPTNDANAPLAPGSDDDRALEALETIHMGMIKVMAERLGDKRIADSTRVEYLRWFLQTDFEPPHWHHLSFETACRLTENADPEIVRTLIFRKQRKRLLAHGE